MNEMIRVAAATPLVVVGDPKENVKRIRKMVNENSENAIIVFPELSVTGYTCADMFRFGYLVEEALEATLHLARDLKKDGCGDNVVIVGVPVAVENMLFNCAAVLNDGEVVGIVPKTHIPNYNEFYEGRWFASADKANVTEVRADGKRIPFGTDLIFRAGKAVIGIDICEDLWTPIPPSTYAALAGANILVNLSASNETVSKKDYRKQLVSVHSAKTISAYVYSSAGTEESSTDLVFSGHSMVAVNGKLVAENIYPSENHVESAVVDLEILKNDRRRMTTFMPGRGCGCFRTVELCVEVHESTTQVIKYDPHPFVPKGKKNVKERCDEITDIQANGLATRLRHIHVDKMVIGISGGLDSTLALLVAVKACHINGIPTKNIICVTMPGFGTTSRTKGNAEKLVKGLGCQLKTIDIREEATVHMTCMGRSTEYQGEGDITYENIQARIRTLYLMDIANQEGAIVVGTGDLSELALGWCTYNGDHMSMYAVNTGVPKTLVKYLVLNYAGQSEFQSLADVLYSICETPISPELAPTSSTGKMIQETEKSIGKYDIHDFCLYHYLRNGFSPDKIKMMAIQTFHDNIGEEEVKRTVETFFWRFRKQQFKRSCLPDGPKIGSISLSPRGDWRMPSDI